MKEPTISIHNLCEFAPIFDNIINNFDSITTPVNRPPHNVIEYNNKYVIEVAVAGYNEDIEVYTEKNYLYIIGGEHSQPAENSTKKYLSRNISTHKFKKQFYIGTLDVSDVKLENGLLTVEIFKDNKTKRNTLPIRKEK